ncbi:MAG: 23S rRNA (pseudouridine(1915)-N(3))-methyltransferase RlmH [Clostridia bacterium]|nr:23S rRNA (pseudouridine(1915)-N(3))-methyltransferase RlmH [Clostridia bacterium]
MRNITVLCLGRLKEGYFRDACAEYLKRLGGFARVQVCELEEERLPDAPSAAQIEAALAAEGKRILAKIPHGAAVVALCVEGKELSSKALAGTLSRWSVNGTSHTVFVIGSSFGLAPEVKAAARLQLSMSPMTFPHGLARVMLLEQLYRAAQIESGGKYHK